jgi:hypothetical protein
MNSPYFAKTRRHISKNEEIEDHHVDPRINNLVDSGVTSDENINDRGQNLGSQFHINRSGSGFFERKMNSTISQ